MHDDHRRVIALLTLALVFFGLVVHYGGAAPRHEVTQESIVKLQSPRRPRR